jgi:hypothetical protein
MNYELINKVVIAINTAKIPYAHRIGFAVQGGITLMIILWNFIILIFR